MFCLLSQSNLCYHLIFSYNLMFTGITVSQWFYFNLVILRGCEKKMKSNIAIIVLSEQYYLMPKIYFICASLLVDTLQCQYYYYVQILIITSIIVWINKNKFCISLKEVGSNISKRRAAVNHFVCNIVYYISVNSIILRDNAYLQFCLCCVFVYKNILYINT